MGFTETQYLQLEKENPWIQWTACCDNSGRLYTITVGTASSGYSLLLSNQIGNPLLFYHNAGIYVLNIPFTRLHESSWTISDLCHNTRVSEQYVLKIGKMLVSFTKDEIAKRTNMYTPQIGGSHGHHLAAQCKYDYLWVFPTRIVTLDHVKPFGLETLRQRRQIFRPPPMCGNKQGTRTSLSTIPNLRRMMHKKRRLLNKMSTVSPTSIIKHAEIPPGLQLPNYCYDVEDDMEEDTRATVMKWKEVRAKAAKQNREGGSNALCELNPSDYWIGSEGYNISVPTLTSNDL
ncbi:hypothetical protein BGZ60DRAFT_402933 [Tricladium varicosporioides]|nr:hypothetical protein BGZ60DRAFT_402933 [Hymenoscyphus varicosporioides]